MKTILNSVRGNIKIAGQAVSNDLSSLKAKILRSKRKPPIKEKKTFKARVKSIGKRKVLGEGRNGKVTALSPLTIRKEYKPRSVEIARQLLDGKTAPQRE